MSKKKNPFMSLALPELPEDIQRIIVVSLPPKAFARSSILSKSWLSFYNSTRYSFDFTFKYDKDKVPEELTQEIMNFDKSLSASLLREKLTVEEFTININHSSHELSDIEYKLRDLVYKWLAALFTTNNIVKVLRIKIWDKYYMPPEIFSNESLQVLHLECDCILDLDRVHPRNLGCLRVLSLNDILIDDKFTDGLLTACPNLEQLTWLNDDFGRQHIIIKGLHKLKYLEIRGLEDVRIQEAPALEKVYVIQREIDDRTIINPQVCTRIKRLYMSVYSERTATYIQKIVSCLPALENLTVTMDCATDIRISSRCLKKLKLYISEFNHVLKMVKINAPNLRCYQYITDWPTFSQHLMMKTGMLETVAIHLNIEIDVPRHVLELKKALRMIEQLKLGVDTVNRRGGCVKASRLDQKSNVSATRVIQMLDAGAVKFYADGNFCF